MYILNEVKKNYLTEIIDRVIRQVLSEANNNMTLREFNSDMAKMGFVYREGVGSARVYYIPEYGDISAVTVHCHRDGSLIHGNTIRQVTRTLEKIGWFDDPNNYKKFPFNKWQLLATAVKADTTEEDIKKANEKYKDAEVEPVFQMKNSVCVLNVDDKKVNLCRSIKDRRPLLSDWYDSFEFDKKTHTIPCLKRDNYETLETECYPIKQDGTLDVENMIIESKNRYGKKRI